MRVIVATDGSEDANTAVEWTRRLPLAPDTRLLALAVVPPPVLPAMPEWRTEALTAAVRAAHEATDHVAQQLGPAVETRVAQGDARAVLIDVAGAWGADLLVLGASGRGAVKEFLFGSVSLAVARHAPCPVLVCKGSPRAVRTVTIAHDGSPGARDALRFVMRLPLPATTHARLIGVADSRPNPTTTPGRIGPTVRAAANEVEWARRRALERALAPEVALLRARVSLVDVSVNVGSPAAEIARYADVTETDLLVVGARGLGTLERLVLGSVSESVLRHAACPVLVVRRAR